MQPHGTIYAKARRGMKVLEGALGVVVVVVVDHSCGEMVPLRRGEEVILSLLVQTSADSDSARIILLYSQQEVNKKELANREHQPRSHACSQMEAAYP